MIRETILSHPLMDNVSHTCTTCTADTSIYGCLCAWGVTPIFNAAPQCAARHECNNAKMCLGSCVDVPAVSYAGTA